MHTALTAVLTTATLLAGPAAKGTAGPEGPSVAPVSTPVEEPPPEVWTKERVAFDLTVFFAVLTGLGLATLTAAAGLAISESRERDCTRFRSSPAPPCYVIAHIVAGVGGGVTVLGGIGLSISAVRWSRLRGGSAKRVTLIPGGATLRF